MNLLLDKKKERKKCNHIERNQITNQGYYYVKETSTLLLVACANSLCRNQQ
jgi:hypothetical protein